MNAWLNGFARYKKNVLILLLLVSIFIISVLVRSKHTGQAMGRHHEWLSAHTLITMQIWNENGAASYGFSPVYSFNNPGDRFDFSFCSLLDSTGNVYYVSYGPFSFILPYAVFKLFGLEINQMNLTAFNLCIHFLISLMLYATVLLLAQKKWSQFSIPALVVFVLYVFSPGTLWFHSNVYFSEILVQLFVAAGLYLVAYTLVYGTSRKLYIAYAMVCFLCVYTEWLGLFFVFFSGTFFLILHFTGKKSLGLFFTAAASGLLALGLIWFQYTSIGGKDALIQSLTGKLASHSGTLLTHGLSKDDIVKDPIRTIEHNLNENFVNVINILAFVVPLFIVLVGWRKKYFFTSPQASVLVILLCMIVLHLVLFYFYTAKHDFSSLKTGMFLILLTGVMLTQLEKAAVENRYVYLAFAFLTLGLVAEKSVFSYGKYDTINHLSTVNYVYKDVGTRVKKLVTPLQTAYVNKYGSPLINIYAHRNVRYSPDGKVARHMSMEYEMTNWFFKVENERCIQATRYSPTGDSLVISFK